MYDIIRLAWPRLYRSYASHVSKIWVVTSTKTILDRIEINHFTLVIPPIGHRLIRFFPYPSCIQLRFMVVIMYFFTKWIKEKPLAIITLNIIQKFRWKFIICRQQNSLFQSLYGKTSLTFFVPKFGLLATLISNNNKQFSSNSFMEFYVSL